MDLEAQTHNHKVERMVIIARAAALLELVHLNAARLSENHSKIIVDFKKLVDDLYLEKFIDSYEIVKKVHDIWNKDDMFSTISSPFFNPETPIDLEVLKNQRNFLN